MVRSFADWDRSVTSPRTKVIKSGIGPPVHILIFDFLRPSSKNAGNFLLPLGRRIPKLNGVGR